MTDTIDPDLVNAQAQAAAVSADATPLIAAAVSAVATAAPWLQAMVQGCQQRIEDLIAQIAAEPDADARQDLQAAVQSELTSLGGWTTPTPPDPSTVAAVEQRDRTTEG